MNYSFRKATPADTPRAWTIILQAKAFMFSEGRNQWTVEYPAIANVEEDTAAGNAYVLCIDDVPMVYGAVIFSGEPAYEQIADKWLSNEDYVVVHRLCVSDDGRGQGLVQKYFEEVAGLALSKGIHSFKIDTNFDNRQMLHILDKCGFAYCGEIIYPQGSRLAFEKLI